MGVNKNAYKRYLIIDELVSRGCYNREELFNQLNIELEISGNEPVSIETLDVDLKDMRRDFNIPILNSRTRGYYYPQAGYRHFGGKELSKEEVRAIAFSASLVGGISEVSLARKAKEILYRLCAKYTTIREELQVVSVEKNDAGLEWLEPLIDAKVKKKAVIIEYGMSKKKSERIYFSVYDIRLFGDQWVVTGFSATKDSVESVALETITGVRNAVGVSYRDNDIFNGEEYFKHWTGIPSHDVNPVKVTFWASTDCIDYLKKHPIHQSQIIVREENGGFMIEMTVCISEDLLVKMMGLGSKVKVIEPMMLVNEFREQTQKMKDYYS